MLCEKCKKNQATVKIIKNYNGNISEEYLCPICAKEENISFNIFPKANMGEGLFNLFSPVASKELTCDKCNTTYSEFKSKGKFGCEECFGKFEKYLDSIFKNIHSSTEHKGKLPKKCGEELRKKKEKEELRDKLSRAIAEERYEDAIVLRDRLKEMEE